MLKNKTVIIGVTGSIAAYKAIGLIKELKKAGANIFVIMTKNATRLVSVKEFENASGNKVSVELFDPKLNYKNYLSSTFLGNSKPHRKMLDKKIEHISLADKADLFLIVPATANIIGKVANGIADDLLSASVMATMAPVLICPAMNVKMWLNPIVRENVQKLRRLGYEFVNPERGMLACGYKGVGRLSGLERIVNEIKKILSRQTDFKNKKVLVTGGATAEDIDPIRMITNKSSGKMGVAIAEEAARRGANVTLIRGVNSVEPAAKLKDIKIKSSNEMFEAIKKNIKNNIIIHTAAVSDFTTKKATTKIKSGKKLNLELSPATKIFEKIKKLNKNIFLVGFKAEYKISQKELINRAYKLLQKSNADLIIANDVGKAKSGFGVDANEVFIVDKKKRVKHIGLDFKRVIANQILDEISLML